MQHVVKRHGQEEPFEEKKLYGSVYAAALNAHHDDQTAEEMANDVLTHVQEWLQERHEVTAKELRKTVKQELEKMDEDVAMLYDTHMEIC